MYVRPVANKQVGLQLSRGNPASNLSSVDLAVSRLADNPAYMLTAKELASAETKGRKAHRKQAG